MASLTDSISSMMIAHIAVARGDSESALEWQLSAATRTVPEVQRYLEEASPCPPCLVGDKGIIHDKIIIRELAARFRIKDTPQGGG